MTHSTTFDNDENVQKTQLPSALASLLFANDFFFFNFLPFCDTIDLTRLLVLNKRTALRTTPFLQTWLAHGWGLPDAEVYEELSQWEVTKGIKMPAELKCFYASWRERTDLFQEFAVTRTVAISQLRRLQLPCRSESLDSLTTEDFLCLTFGELRDEHKAWHVYLVTFLDLHGQVTGVSGGIFDFEYVDNRCWPDRKDLSLKEEVYNELDMNLRGNMYRGLGYSVRNISINAHNIFEFLSMMQHNQLYFDESESQSIYVW